MKLLLFDIDGTLVRSNGAGRAALAAVLEEMYGTAGPVANYRMDGKTDPRIISDLLAAAGVPARQIAERLPAIYDRLATMATAIYPAHRIHPCPGVVELLAALRPRKDVVLGLLTGNIAQTAPLKLLAAGLDPAQFRLGAYGSDHMDRNQLPAIAMNRATDLMGQSLDGGQTVIIGDTPADILCARAGQATAVAVASGWHAAATLAQYNPDYLFDNLANTDRVLAALLGQAGGTTGQA